MPSRSKEFDVAAVLLVAAQVGILPFSTATAPARVVSPLFSCGVSGGMDAAKGIPDSRNHPRTRI